MLRSRFPLRFTRQAVASAIAASFGATALAQPAGLTAVHGNAVVQQQGAATTVTTTNGAGTRHSALDWRSFQVPGGAAVYFAQPDALSTSINRVTGGDPSGIYGRLGSNGRFVLVNPAGITVGAGAVVDTAGFTASTLALGTADAIAARLRFGGADAAGGALNVQGQVLARGGDVVLLAPQVETGAGALVQAQGGDVILGAGRKVELTGRGLEGIRLEVRAPDDRAVNLGTLRGDSVAIFASRLRHSGVIEASSATASGGRVVLQGGTHAEVAGAITAASARQGGSVHVSAERLVLKAATSIDVSHARGGGEILVGGGWQGADARIANALATEVEQGVVLKADATLSGPGGTVVVWSDGSTRFRGTVLARGAGAAGAGGRAEVSGRRQLVFRGRADLGADNGAVGTLLLDPDVLTIRGGSGDGSDLDPLPDATLANVTPLDLPADYTVFQSELEGMNANVSLQAGEWIRASGTFDNGELRLQNNRDLRLEVNGGGAGGIDLRGMPVRVTGNGRVELRTANSGQAIWTDRITTSSGDIDIRAQNGTIHVPGRLSASNSARVRLQASAIEFRGTHDFGNREIELNAGTVLNTGTWNLSGTTLSMGGGGATPGAGGSALTNAAGAVIAGQGTLRFGSGTLGSGGGGLLNLGTLRPGGSGAIGRLTVDGALVLAPGGTLAMEVRDAASHDELRVTGPAVVGGRLEVASLAYTPGASDSYRFVDAGTRVGTFVSTVAPAFPGFAPVYGGSEVRFAQPATAAATPGPAPAPAPGAPPPSAPVSPETGTAPPGTGAPAAGPVAAPAPAAAAPAEAAAQVTQQLVAFLQDRPEPESSEPRDGTRKRVAVTNAACVVSD